MQEGSAAQAWEVRHHGTVKSCVIMREARRKVSPVRQEQERETAAAAEQCNVISQPNCKSQKVYFHGWQLKD